MWLSWKVHCLCCDCSIKKTLQSVLNHNMCSQSRFKSQHNTVAPKTTKCDQTQQHMLSDTTYHWPQNNNTTKCLQCCFCEHVVFKDIKGHPVSSGQLCFIVFVGPLLCFEVIKSIFCIWGHVVICVDWRPCTLLILVWSHNVGLWLRRHCVVLHGTLSCFVF